MRGLENSVEGEKKNIMRDRLPMVRCRYTMNRPRIRNGSRTTTEEKATRTGPDIFFGFRRGLNDMTGPTEYIRVSSFSLFFDDFLFSDTIVAVFLCLLFSSLTASQTTTSSLARSRPTFTPPEAAHVYWSLASQVGFSRSDPSQNVQPIPITAKGSLHSLCFSCERVCCCTTCPVPFCTTSKGQALCLSCVPRALCIEPRSSFFVFVLSVCLCNPHYMENVYFCFPPPFQMPALPLCRSLTCCSEWSLTLSHRDDGQVHVTLHDHALEDISLVLRPVVLFFPEPVLSRSVPSASPHFLCSDHDQIPVLNTQVQT